MDECASVPCENAGVCSESQGDASIAINSYSCTCAAGWQGNECASDVDECLSNPCQNGATCQDSWNGTLIDAYECICMTGWEGALCDGDVDDCSSAPCVNGGVCENTGLNSFFCACTIEWGGTHCMDYDECLSQPCQNAGACFDSLQQPFHVRINFQPSLAQVPSDYFADHGDLYQSVNGLEYGWSCQLSAFDFRDLRDSDLSARDNTILIIDRYSQCEDPVRWDIAVTNGAYEVTVGYKDPNLRDQQASRSDGCILSERVSSRTGGGMEVPPYQFHSSTIPAGVGDVSYVAHTAIALYNYTNAVSDPEYIDLIQGENVSVTGMPSGEDYWIGFTADAPTRKGKFPPVYVQLTGAVTRNPEAFTAIVYVEDGNITLEGDYVGNCSALSYIEIKKPGVESKCAKYPFVSVPVNSPSLCAGRQLHITTIGRSVQVHLLVRLGRHDM